MQFRGIGNACKGKSSDRLRVLENNVSRIEESFVCSLPIKLVENLEYHNQLSEKSWDCVCSTSITNYSDFIRLSVFMKKKNVTYFTIKCYKWWRMNLFVWTYMYDEPTRIIFSDESTSNLSRRVNTTYGFRKIRSIFNVVMCIYYDMKDTRRT